MRNMRKVLAVLLAALSLAPAALAADPVAVLPAPAGKPVAASTVTKEDKERAELRTKTYRALLDLYKRNPKSRKAIQDAFGYAVFVDTSYSAGFLGGGHGRGRAINQHSGREVFMKMGEMKVGLGLGVRQSNIIFVFGNEDAFNSFITKGWSFGGQAVASAEDGVHGDSLEGSFQVAPGMWMYQVTTKGLAAELSVKGTRFYVDKDLNVNTVVNP
ncbi:YSC84-related protein [Acidaminococcus sp.]|uniref:YSC84-related protein n=1 Tax=Acidaminococcus sp. TaxID=1872103 RepID=UPI003D7C5411